MKWPAILITLIIIAGAAIYLGQRPADLGKLHEGIVSDYAGISHISGEVLGNQAGDDIILLDIREPEEFAVSHLAGAQRIDPAVSTEQMLTQLPPNLNGKTVIVYCSVGRRSSDLASRVKDSLMAAGAADVVNLEGGIFSWHNERRPLVTNGGPTEYVHPYDEFWKRYVKHRDLTRYSPKP